MATRSGSRTTLIWLSLFVLLALGLRVGFSMGESWDDEADRYLYSGNDPYYHDRTVHHIVDKGEHLLFDPAINYPQGNYNPNPPIFDWTTAPVAGVLDQMGAADPVGLALNIMVAVWGALTVIPVYFLGRDLFGRLGGIWAAFFMAFSAPHITRSVFGFADHDATTLFFLAFAFMALVKALNSLDRREFVRDWRDATARKHGIRDAWRHNQAAMAWATVSGVALSAVALTWKGYPYALAVMAVAVGLQLLQDHAKNRDSTAMFLAYMIPLAIGVLLPYLLFYQATPFAPSTVIPSLYILVGVLIAALVLVPTRDMPSIVVFPALVLAAALGLLVLFFVLPDVARMIFSGLGYFEQSKLFSTISEAQRSNLGEVAANFGFFTFVLAFWGLARTIRLGWKGDAKHVFMASWALVAVFMAFAASRFISNAAPVFAILMAGPCATIVGWAGYTAVKQRYRRAHGQGAGGTFSALTWRAVFSTLLIALLLVVPNMWIGVDASTPFSYDRDKGWVTFPADPVTGERSQNQYDDKMGALGISFSMRGQGWLGVLSHLATLDQDIEDIEDRPAFIAWWDYGHWATDVGKHPTVADPFQNHYAIAGRFLAATSEEAGVGWLAYLLATDAYAAGGQQWADARAALESHDPRLVDTLTTGDLDGRVDHYVNITAELGPDAAFDVYDSLVDATGKEIRYFGVDDRMWGGGIFYAPAYLADKNPDDFIRTTLTGADGRTYTESRYTVTEDGVRDRPQTVYIAPDGKEFVLVGTQLFPKGNVPIAARTGGAQGIGISDSDTQPTALYYETMYAQAFGHIDIRQAAAGQGLTHWRAIAQETDGLRRQAVVLEYFRGINVQGIVTDDLGQPLEGAQVGFVDGFGAVHDFNATGSDGRYTVLAPFAQDNDLTFVVVVGGERVVERNVTSGFTREHARAGHTIASGFDAQVERGGLTGTIYRNVDGAQGYNASADEALAGARVELGGQNATTDSQGRYTLTNLQPGGYDMRISLDGFQTRTASVTVAPGKQSTSNQTLSYAPIPIEVTAQDEGGQPIANATVSIIDASTTQSRSGGTTDAQGVFSGALAPGMYNITVRETRVENPGDEPAVFQGQGALTVTFGEARADLTVVLTRQ